MIAQRPILADTPVGSDDELARLIDPWLQHMRWRADFADWRHRRLHSEDFQAEMLAQVSEVARSLAGRLLLDLGCGMGGFAVAAGRAGGRVTALDYNRAYCRITAARGLRYGMRMLVVQAAGEALPAPSAAYDIVTAWDVIEHVQRPERMLAEIARVLRPGGVAVMTAINRFAFRDPHYHLPLLNYLPRPLGELLIRVCGRSKRGSVFRDRQRLGEMHYFTFRAFRRLAARHGFTIIDLDEARVRRGDLAPRRRRRRLVLRAIQGLGLALPLYRLYRAFYQGTYRLQLIKEPERG